MPKATRTPKVITYWKDFNKYEMTFRQINGKVYLEPANSAYKPIEVTKKIDMGIQVVNVWVSHKLVKQ